LGYWVSVKGKKRTLGNRESPFCTRSAKEREREVPKRPVAVFDGRKRK